MMPEYCKDQSPRGPSLEFKVAMLHSKWQDGRYDLSQRIPSATSLCFRLINILSTPCPSGQSDETDDFCSSTNNQAHASEATAHTQLECFTRCGRPCSAVRRWLCSKLSKFMQEHAMPSLLRKVWLWQSNG